LNNSSPGDYSTLPLENAAQIDAACDAFERAWKSDEVGIPRLEDFLMGMPAEFRDIGLHELLVVELEYRRLRRLPLVPDDFAQRFPDRQLPTHLSCTGRSNDDHRQRLSTHDQLGKYSIICWLGSGGMGEVYRARDATLNRDVAIKLLLSRYRKNAQALARIRLEAQALASLNHPNIVTIHEFVEWENTAFLVLELLDGETLAQRLKRGPIDPGEAVQIAVSLAMGLAAAHDRGIIHRDIKPQNIFFTKNGIPKLLDLGLARLAESPVSDGSDPGRSEKPGDTVSGSRVGTTGYMSPEQIRGELVTAPSDIFSFGCVLYEMLEGLSPFARSTPSATDLAILTEPAPQLQTTRHAAARAMAPIVNRCLSKSATERFSSAGELLAELRRITAVPAAQATNLRWIERLVTVTVAISIIVLSVWYWQEQRVKHRIDAIVSSAPIPSTDDNSLDQLKIVVRELHRLRLANPSWRNNIESVIRGSVGAPEYHAYMLGHLSLEGGTNNDFKAAITYFEKAIALNPDFAAALAALGECYYRRSNTYASPSEMMPNVQRFARAALQRNPSLASAHVLLGLYEHRYRWNWPQAQAHFREALMLNPNSLLAHHMSGNSLVLAGEFDEGIERLQWARVQDPESQVIAVDLALAYLYAGRIDDAEQQLQDGLAADPNYFPARWALGELYLHRQDWASAIRELQVACALDDSPEATAELAFAMAKSGDHRAALALLRDLKTSSRTRYVPPTAIAVAHIGLAQQAEALDALRLGFQQHDEWLVWLEVDPVFDDLRHNAAFEALRAAPPNIASE
jgi:serine/threonine protein kinase